MTLKLHIVAVLNMEFITVYPDNHVKFVLNVKRDIFRSRDQEIMWTNKSKDE